MRVLFVLLFATGYGLAFAGPPLELIQTIPLPGVEGRIDHMTIDSGLNRLYVAALGNGTVEVIDLAAGKRVSAITGLSEPQGVQVVPSTHTLVVASGGDGTCRFYDTELKMIGKLDNMDDADNVRYDSVANRIYVGYGGGHLATIDPVKPSLTTKVALSGHPESFQLESGGRVFINVPSMRQVTVVDRKSGEIVRRWKVDEARSNFPMALDEKNKRLFVACREPAKLLVLNTETGATPVILDCVGDADDVFYDVDRARIYVAGGEGLVSVLSQSDADHYAFIGAVTTAPGARTALFSREANRLYVAVPHRGEHPAEIRVFEAR